ncbi:trypsin-like peptidase domain-containing protein [Variovorax sp. JS1663]|uniref:trypsin-like peptidase domain-containing protein n=1 Tax=Variovorax sp. JS1663 TaxID=1851577 RepID=UPI00117FE041|nr:trypsin-like peptidase domain-containing protein [Variovorax sp. JS1663]
MKRLTPDQLEAARDALVDGYRNWAALKQLAAFALDINLEAKVGKGPLDDVAFDLLELTEAKGWTEMLLRDAAARNPGNEMLGDIAAAHGLAPAPFTGPAAAALDAGFQARVIQASGLESAGRWRQQMIRCERRVCQIRSGGEPIGTGFLVGPRLVMSNWHVFESAPGSGQLGEPKNYAACFDFRAAEGQAPADPGIEVPADPVADYLDTSHKLELDYALLQLAHDIGNEPMPDGTKRGWLALGTRQFELPKESCIVLQHPAGRTLEVAAGTVTGWLQGHEQAIYEHTAETDRGSSGSPCFASGWTLLGLHHRTGPKANPSNRAIATSAIVERLRAKGRLGLLPAQG